MGLSLLYPLGSLGKHKLGFQCADRLISCDVVPCAWTCYPLSCWANTVLCVDGDGGHTDRISGRSRKWELEGSCYQAPSFLLVLHGVKLKPCVFSPCGRPHTAGLVDWLASAVGFLTTCDLRKRSAPPVCHCYLNLTSVQLYWGPMGKVVSDSSLCPVYIETPLLFLCFHWRLGARWMWLGKYSSLSSRLKVISWYSSCHGLTRSRLEKMA